MAVRTVRRHRASTPNPPPTPAMSPSSVADPPVWPRPSSSAAPGDRSSWSTPASPATRRPPTCTATSVTTGSRRPSCLRIARDEVRSYGVTVIDGIATDLVHDDGGFRVGLADGTSLLPGGCSWPPASSTSSPTSPVSASSGVEASCTAPTATAGRCGTRPSWSWPRVRIATHQALLFRQLSDRVTLVVHDDGAEPGAEDRARLAAVRIEIVRGPVDAVDIDERRRPRACASPDGRSSRPTPWWWRPASSPGPACWPISASNRCPRRWGPA